MRPLALTLGDPDGIGPEITAKAWTALRDQTDLAFALVTPAAPPDDPAPADGVACAPPDAPVSAAPPHAASTDPAPAAPSRRSSARRSMRPR